MRLPIAALLALLCLTRPADAQTVPPAPPKLIVAISVDQFSAALFREYRPHFTGGLRRLAGGIVFAGAFQAHGTTETCPGHATILTGAHPARNGIVANYWIDFDAPRADKRIYCAEDERAPGSTSGAYRVSEFHLRVPTLGDRMKRADPASRVVAVAGKDRAAAMLGGHEADQRWWWKGGRFVQNHADAPAPVAEQVNAAVAAAIAVARAPLTPPPFCAAKAKAVAVGRAGSVGTFRFERAAGDAAAFARGPEMDAATLTLAAGLVHQMQLGRGPATDLLAIGLSATDYVGHRYGSEGVEMCLQLMSLDSDLHGFFTLLDRLGLDYAVVLTADHGSLDLPERAPGSGERLDRAATPGAVGDAVARQLGLPGPAFVGDWYLASTVPEGRRGEALALARQLLAAHPQVHATHTADEIAATPLPSGDPAGWSIVQRLRASYDAQRSPDLFVVHKPEVTAIPDPGEGYVATHGTVWDHDRKVPILFWSPMLIAQQRDDHAMTVDIMPTLASLIGLNVPGEEIDGRCLDLVPGQGSNCP